MEEESRQLVAFHLTGRRPAGLDAVGGLDLRPALLAGYRDLTRLRYDFPLVLVRGASAERACVESLSGVVDGVVREIARGGDGDRLTHHALRLEREIRAAVAGGAAGSLALLWDEAADRLSTRGDDLLRDSLGRARAALTVDGDVVDCGGAMPARLVEHAWAAAQEARARRWREEVGGLIQRLSDILRVDFVRSEAGRSAEALAASVGSPHRDVFDFAAMSRILARPSADAALPASRRRRIERLLAVLESQRFFGAPGSEPPYSFVFGDCRSALAAYRERLPETVEVARAIAIAELEVDARYSEDRHDALFAELGAHGLDARDMARFPSYLVCTDEAGMHGAESDTLIEILAAGLPMKVLVQTDDVLEKSAIGGDAHLGFGLRGKQLADMAVGLNEVYVLRATGSQLFQLRERVLDGLSFSGPALFSVFSGAGGSADGLPPYLVAAAAAESRAFPAFSYDPSAGATWAARFRLEANPQVDLDWPVQRFAYEDENHQRVETDVAFTPIDFVACDRRFAGHFARVPRAKWDALLVPVDEFLSRDAKAVPDAVPCILMVDGENRLQKVVVDDELVRAALRCRDAWHSLQELGGVHNSHAERLLAREREVWEERRQREAAVAPAPAEAAPAVAAAEPEPAHSPDDPYIESARCTTCNECMRINNKMFGYDENRQARVVDPDAGTYRQLVEAAESCQVAIIHPGTPRDPNEPGLEDLLKRAAPFR